MPPSARPPVVAATDSLFVPALLSRPPPPSPVSTPPPLPPPPEPPFEDGCEEQEAPDITMSNNDAPALPLPLLPPPPPLPPPRLVPSDASPGLVCPREKPPLSLRPTTPTAFTPPLLSSATMALPLLSLPAELHRLMRPSKAAASPSSSPSSLLPASFDGTAGWWDSSTSPPMRPRGCRFGGEMFWRPGRSECLAPLPPVDLHVHGNRGRPVRGTGKGGVCLVHRVGGERVGSRRPRKKMASTTRNTRCRLQAHRPCWKKGDIRVFSGQVRESGNFVEELFVELQLRRVTAHVPG